MSNWTNNWTNKGVLIGSVFLASYWGVSFLNSVSGFVVGASVFLLGGFAGYRLKLKDGHSDTVKPKSSPKKSSKKINVPSTSQHQQMQSKLPLQLRSLALTMVHAPARTYVLTDTQDNYESDLGALMFQKACHPSRKVTRVDGLEDIVFLKSSQILASQYSLPSFQVKGTKSPPKYNKLPPTQLSLN